MWHFKAIPTLYGEDAVRFHEEIENVDQKCGDKKVKKKQNNNATTFQLN